jgi:S-DNA-T family DNA segregation ATPase FtsK/SpoIIIE
LGDGGKGGLSSIGSRLGLGGDKDKPATPKGESGGRFGALKGKLPFGKQDDKSGARPGGGTGSAPARSALGGAIGSGAGAKTSTGTFPSAKTSTGTHAAAKGASAQKGGLGSILGSLPLFGGKKADDKKAAAKQRASKAPKVESTGLSLDTKLDILGVALVLGSLALILSGLSPTKGALTEQVNTILARTFGWGAIAVPIAMLGIGGWLILRHFGDEAPTVDKTQLLGKVMLYIGALVLFQYVDTFINPQFGDYASLTPDLLKEFLTTFTVNQGRGGGLVGAELYFLLFTNFGEIGGFFVLLGWMIVSIMLALELSAAELAIIVISVGRSFRDAQQRRAQARAAQRAAQQAALPQITVAKPEAEQLPGGTSPALPAPTPTAATPQPESAPALTTPERSIPVTMGGRTIGTFSRGGDLTPAETTPEAPPKPQPAGGFASRLRQSMPAVNLPGAKPAPEAPAESDKGGRRLFGRRPAEPEKSPADGEKAAATGRGLFGKRTNEPEKPAATTGAAEGEQPAGGFGRQLFGTRPAEPEKPAETEKPAASAGVGGRLFGQRSNEPEKTAATTDKVEDEKPAGGLGRQLFGTRPAESEKPAEAEKPAVSGGGRPFGKPAEAEKPLITTPSGDGEQPAGPEKPAALTPAATKPAALSSPFAPKPTAARPSLEKDDLDDVDEDFEDEEDDAPVRLGDLVRPRSATPPPSPFARPTPGKPSASPTPKGEPAGTAKPPVTPPKPEDDEELANLPPARPKGTGPLPRPGDDMRSRFGAPPRPESKPTLGDRQERLNAIRGGQLGKPEPASRPDGDKPETKPATESAEKQPAASIEAKPPAASAPSPTPAAKEQPERRTPIFGKLPDDQAEKQEESKPAALIPTPSSLKSSPVFNVPSSEPPVRAAVRPSQTPLPPRKQKDWKLPDYKTLLMPGSEQDFDREFLLRRARIIEETLQSFGAPGRVVEVNTGPVITQFGVEPDYLVMRSGKKNRVKVSAIAQLDKDLQLALGAKSIRIEAPVPGKGYVGVEVPNEEAALVSLRDVMDSDEFRRIDSPLAIALGQSVDGTPVAADLAVMPHLLIAGTTGSGKSVCVNAIISSLLLRNTPDKLKMIMIDPKRVELTGYNGIPHLVAPVVVDLERIVGVLKWVTREMDERYKRFSNAGARNIEDFNKHLPAGEEWMPYIVVIIDELADLMMLAPDETERVITRIAALARATGIHLVIATQRPSVDVVTGLIKANFPARIAFAVAGGVDSRVILDQPGAERLLGRGDMLYMSGDSPAPVRLQGVFVSDVEINNITRYWKSQVDEDTPMRPIPMVLDSSVPAEPARSVLPEEKRTTQQAFWERESARANGDREDDDDVPDGEDEMYDEAVELVRRLGKASVSLLQRRLRIGYTRAARLIDLMEERGVVGPAESGSKPREVLPVED